MLPACDYDLFSMVSVFTFMIHSICLLQLKFYVRTGLVHCLGHVTQDGRLVVGRGVASEKSASAFCFVKRR